MILSLIAKTQLTADTWTFQFTSEQPITWVAGQFIKIELPHAAPDAAGPARRFTIAASPQDRFIAITTRLSGTTFKRALSQLAPGQTVHLLDTPAGDFIWRPAAHPHIFVARGIGITPFYAIIKDRRGRDLPINAHLVYSTRTGSDIIFQRELTAWTHEDPTFQVSFQSDPVTPAQLGTKFPDLSNRFVYVSGPKPLIALCLPPYSLPPSHLKQDNFPGYPAETY